ncbi:Cytochrome P450 [Streptomyces sp. yr375]|uniref:cytochrome P450 n=1 Tax=Streptomyces sp. yr375 TaxID=1761906 RepID=UPI0008C7B18D|nr:cytochrome P450 [Streptomyces sp. yr375]SES48303.1 Cytochrome P450 [Streptomyces sp. yr375]
MPATDQQVTGPVMGPAEALSELFTPAGKHHPYPLYDALWELGPVIPLGPSGTLVLGYDEICTALRDPRFLVTDAAVHRSTGMIDHSSWQCFTKIMMFSNSPDHERMRRFSGWAYSPRQVAERRDLAVKAAERWTDRLAALDDGGPLDLVEAFATRVPMTVTGELLGIPEADRMGLRTAVTATTTAFEPVFDPRELAPADAGMDVLVDYLGGLVRERRRRPGDDLVSAMVRDRDADGAVTEEELVAGLVMFVIAGVQSPSDMIGNTVRLALEHPAEGRGMTTDDDLLAAFVTETLRIDPPNHVLTRAADTDIDFYGHRVAAGSRALLVLAAANRDRRRFTDPATFDLARKDNRPLSFGLGPHYCLGAAFARMQVEVAVPVLLRRFPRLALAAPPAYRDQLVTRGFARMDVTLGS